jgi:hypothetical protein
MEEEKKSILIPTSVLAEALELVKEAIEKLGPYVNPLTPHERKVIPKMGEKTLSFVEKAYEFAKQSPELVPPFLDMVDFKNSFLDAHDLWSLFLKTQQLHENVDDTTMLAGSEAYQDSLIFYNSVKMAARQNVVGAKAVYEELKKRFPGRKRKDESED